MATLEHIDFVPTRYLLESKQIKSMPVKGGKVTTGLPQIIWESGRPWMEACLWAHERLILLYHGLGLPVVTGHTSFQRCRRQYKKDQCNHGTCVPGAPH